MKINISIKSVIKVIKLNISRIILVGIIITLLWLIYFTYQNLYPTIFNPQEIDKNEIIARKQKVNIELFNEINQEINQKQTTVLETDDIQNLFK